jgi:hypothetical protein
MCLSSPLMETQQKHSKPSVTRKEQVKKIKKIYKTTNLSFKNRKKTGFLRSTTKLKVKRQKRLVLKRVTKSRVL